MAAALYSYVSHEKIETNIQSTQLACFADTIRNVLAVVGLAGVQCKGTWLTGIPVQECTAIPSSKIVWSAGPAYPFDTYGTASTPPISQLGSEGVASVNSTQPSCPPSLIDPSKLCGASGGYHLEARTLIGS